MTVKKLLSILNGLTDNCDDDLIVVYPDYLGTDDLNHVPVIEVVKASVIEISRDGQKARVLHLEGEWA